MAVDQQLTTREQVRGFNNAFERPVHESWTSMSVTDRILVGKLLLEEVVEYVVKGLGLDFQGGCYDVSDPQCYVDDSFTALKPGFVNMADVDAIVNVLDIVHREGRVMDPVECVDGLADVNIVIHFNAHWHGFNLDRATTIVNDSNMSKLGADGRPIINGVTPGYRCEANLDPDMTVAFNQKFTGERGYDDSKPLGKILKGPNYWEPTSLLSALIAEAGNNKP